MASSSVAIRVETDVDCDPLEAFERLTSGVDYWWAAYAAFGVEGAHEVDLERYAGGRVVTDGEDQAPDVELGRMTLWRPGGRLEAEWREPSWPSGVVTSIVTSFEYSGTSTHITVEHVGFEHLGASAQDTAQRYEARWAELLATVARGR